MKNTTTETTNNTVIPANAGKIVTAYAMSQTALTHGRQLKSWWTSRHTFTVTIRADDPIYEDVHVWLLGAISPAKSPRSLLVGSENSSSSVRDLEVARDYDTSPARVIKVSYDDTSQQEITLGVYKVKVNVQRAEDAAIDSKGRVSVRPDSIHIHATTAEGRDAVVDYLREILTARSNEKRQPVLWLLNNWGSWQRRQDLPLRTLDSVVLRAGQIETIVDDLELFLARESEYVRRGIPWHRGYLFHGPPGTGKTSLVKALASHFGLDLWYAPLGDLQKDANLMSLLNEVRPRSILLLEDIDSFHAATEREDETGQVSMSGLLNALDGVATPHGLITVLTTNFKEAIDPALLRPGRVDRSEHLDLPDNEQVVRLFTTFYGRPPSFQLPQAKIATADIMEIFKRHMFDPDAAEVALVTPRLSTARR